MSQSPSSGRSAGPFGPGTICTALAHTFGWMRKGRTMQGHYIWEKPDGTLLAFPFAYEPTVAKRSPLSTITLQGANLKKP